MLRQPQQHIAPGHGPGQFPAAFHSPHRKSGQIEIAGRIHAGHFCGLAADQGATGRGATCGNALDNACGAVNIQLAGGEIIQKKQRLRALTDQIVDAHGDQINADGVHISGINRNPQLGADPIGGGHQNRIAKACVFEVKQRSEPAQPGHNTGPVCSLGRPV